MGFQTHQKRFTELLFICVLDVQTQKNKLNELNLLFNDK